MAQRLHGPLRSRIRFVFWALVFAFMDWGPPLSALPGETATPWTLLSQVKVDASGVFLDQIFTGGGSNGVVHARLCDAPPVGRVLNLTVPQITALGATIFSNAPSQTFTGATTVQISRRMRTLSEAELLQGVSSYLQQNLVREQGELELKFLRGWTAVQIADEPYTLRLLDLPQGGLSPAMQLRLELVAGRESLGMWLLGLEAHVWRNIWVCQQQFKRGDLVAASDFSLERRDVLRLRDLLPEEIDFSRGWQMAENLNPGQPVLRRSLQLRTVVQRGQMVDALLKDGPISISLRAEVLDAGVPGQLIRLRNPLSRRELRGKVINEQVVHIQM